MEVDKIIKIVEDVENKSNKDLIQVQNILQEEHEKTKKLIIDFTRHLDGIETLYKKINKELTKRKIV